MNFDFNSLQSVFNQNNKKEEDQDYNSNSINSHSQSLGFTLFANSNRHDTYRNYIQNKEDGFAYPEHKDLTIGFQNRQNFQFFEKSNHFSDNAKMQIKKPNTFQIITNYNIIQKKQYEHKREQEETNHKHKSIGFTFGSQKNNEIDKKGGKQSYTSNLDDQNSRSSAIKIENDCCFWSQADEQSRKKSIRKRQRRTQQKSQQSQFSLQNLKSIAKIVFDVIKQKKSTTYKQLTNVLSAFYYQELQKQMKVQQNQMVLDYLSKDKEIVNKMIKNTTFSYISQIKIENQQYQKVKFEHNERRMETQKNLQERVEVNMKNIRRRLYDALNVMIAAGIVIKKKETLSLKVRTESIANSSPYAASLSENYEQLKKQYTYQQLQGKIAHKIQVLAAKKMFRESLIAKYLNIKSIIKRNKNTILQQQHSSNREKQQINNNTRLFFPLILASIQLPIQIQIGNKNQWATVDTNQNISLVSDVDSLSYVSWVQTDKIKQMEKQLNERVNQKFLNYQYQIAHFFNNNKNEDQQNDDKNSDSSVKQYAQQDDNYIQQTKRKRSKQNQKQKQKHKCFQNNKGFQKNKKVKMDTSCTTSNTTVDNKASIKLENRLSG